MKKTLMYGIVLSCLIIAAACLIYVPSQDSSYRRPPETRPYDTRDSYRSDASRVGIDIFYNELAPYGYWIEHAAYGYVWMPRYVEFNWRPYTNGQWVWTDYGWTWLSHYDWGWAPFHYGRWDWDDSLGWFWVPDTLWGPAWVTWRRGDMYFGWAALPPRARFMPGVGITSLSFPLHDSAWVFVESRYFPSSRIQRYVLPWERNMRIINITVIETNIVMQDRRIFNRGLDLDLVQRAGQQRISKYQLVDGGRPGRSKIRLNEMEAYRPTVEIRENVRPKSVITSGEARERINRGRISGAESTSTGKVRLEDIQKRETQLLEESQQKEIIRLKQRREVEEKKAETAQEKQAVEKEQTEEIKKIQKTHEEAKTRLKKRHEAETQKVTKTKIKK